MATARIRWRLEGGFSDLVEGAAVELRLRAGRSRQSLDTAPVGYLKGRKPAVYDFEVSRPVRGRGPGGSRWELLPESSVQLKILPAGSAFLGNFRVPEESRAWQWTIVARVTAGSSRRWGITLADVRSASRLGYIWVTDVDSSLSFPEALAESWRLFRNPLDGASMRTLGPRQVCQLTWTGNLRVTLAARWRVAQGWSFGVEPPLLELGQRLTAAAAWTARLRLTRSGGFSLRATRRRGILQWTVRRERGLEKASSFRVEVAASPRPVLRSTSVHLDPLLDPLRRHLPEALSRRAALLLALESTRRRRDTAVIRAEFKEPLDDAFVAAYDRVARGEVPETAPGLKVTSVFETLTESQTSISLRLVRWPLSLERRKTLRRTVSTDPLGNLVVEEGYRLEETRRRWDDLQFFRLLYERRPDGDAARFDWSWGREERMGRIGFRGLAGIALRVGALESYAMPGGVAFPVRIRMAWLTRFSAEGLNAIRRSGTEERWRALAEGLEIAEPERYGRPTFWRDWIESADLRAMVDRDPIQSHLAVRYPIPGRSEFQRRQVVDAYRGARAFLRLLEIWAEGSEQAPTEALERGLKMPIFVCFHLLCPPELRRSAIVATGDFEAVWGDVELARGLR
jgi:hypothetical protein